MFGGFGGLTSKLFGQDPKLEFRKAGAGVSLLCGQTISPEEPYWAQYWLLFDSPTDVLTLLDSTTLSTANPANLSTLTTVLSSHLFSLLSLPSFPHSQSGTDADLAREALNCVRVLSRVVPFVIKGPQYGDEMDRLEEAVFWRREKVKVEKPVAEDEEGQFVIDDEEETDEAEEQWEEEPPLAEKLLAALVDLLFVPGFTVAEECRTEDGAVAYVIWEPGIASSPTPAPPTPQSLLSARLEILRLLTLLLALPSLLTPPHAYPVLLNPWREALVSTTLERNVVLCLLCSVLNTAFASPKTSSGALSGLAGLGLGAAEKIGGVVLRREDVRGLLVGTCLHLLAILFTEHAPPSSPAPATNAFGLYLSKLHRATDFDFLLEGAFAVLAQSLAQPLLLGPGAGNKIGMETLVVLWRSMEVNSKLFAYMLESERAGELLVWLVSAALEYRDDETQMGLVRLAAFVMQCLSADPRIANRLNEPVNLRLSLRGKYNVPGTLADFLIVSIYTLVFTTKARLSALYPAFVLTIANASPYFKNLSVVSSTRLLQLFLAFSAPQFLLMEEGNPRLVYYLLETFNNVIHFQLSDNPNLIYAIVRAHDRFDQLATFTLSAGVVEVRRVRQERKAAAAVSPAPSSPAPAAGNQLSIAETLPKIGEGKEGGEEKEGEEVGSPGSENRPEVSEKARGKRRERGGSVSTIAMGELGLEEEGEAFVGKNGFVPTEGWVSSWREGLPLDGIHILLSELRPKVLELSSTNQEAATSFLSSASLSGLLPPPPPLRPRRFIFTPQSVTWLASLVYGSVYLGSLELLRDVPVQLFAIAQARRAASAVDLVSGAASFVLSRARGVGSGTA